MLTLSRLKILLNSALLFTSVLWYSACLPEGNLFSERPAAAYRPVYGSGQHAEIKWLDPQSVKNPGKIYVYGSYLLVNEKDKGIHVFNNADPENPQPLGFIQMLGNSDVAIRNNILYADHMGNLIALKINQFNDVEEVDKLPLKNWELGVPPPSRSYFECIDQGKGLVIEWKKVDNLKADCYAL